MPSRSFTTILALLTATAEIFCQELIDFDTKIRPLMAIKCFECHNTGNTKGGVNLDNYKERERVVADGPLWLKVLEQIKTRSMPPKGRPPLSEDDYVLLTEGIDEILESALEERKPGQIVIRRLSHSEYRHTILDLLGVDFDSRNYFPSDGSGGGGFDNQGRALFITPLKFERYYDAADAIVARVAQDETLWSKVVPFSYRQMWYQKFFNWIKSLFSEDYQVTNPPVIAAQKVIFPFATKAYRRFLKDDEKTRLTGIFNNVYSGMDSVDNPQRFNESVAVTMKTILVSPNFLYRMEEEPEQEGPYFLSNFELATRLSYFLWSSMPDDELFNLAYRGLLQDTVVLEAQVKRMLADPKIKRFAESFSTQWLGITRLIDNQPLADVEEFPEFNRDVRSALYQEPIEYFFHVLTTSRNLMDLIAGNYTFLNEELAAYYDIEGVTSSEFQKVILRDSTRGGILGMGGVLALTSLPHRTSPVLRGKWVMEQILGTSPPPPPAQVAELSEDEDLHSELGLRAILEIHRSKPACISCHEKMDPLGLGLENFDAIGRWRESYGKVPIDASGILTDGRQFQGPAELKLLLASEEEKIARNFSSLMLSYALGRSVLFTDEPALRHLDNCLIENGFDPQRFIVELVKTYPFRMKMNDFREKVHEII